MSKQDTDEVPLRTVVWALFIAAIAIAIFLFPLPTAEAPKVELEAEQHFVETVEAAEIEEITTPQEVAHEFDELADAIIDCESSGRAHVEIIDTNGKWSRGAAQFQDRTWEWMSAEAGVTGSPLEYEKARAVLLWALENGHGSHWTCFHKVTRNY